MIKRTINFLALSVALSIGLSSLSFLIATYCPMYSTVPNSNIAAAFYNADPNSPIGALVEDLKAAYSYNDPIALQRLKSAKESYPAIGSLRETIFEDIKTGDYIQTPDNIHCLIDLSGRVYVGKEAGDPMLFRPINPALIGRTNVCAVFRELEISSVKSSAGDQIIELINLGSKEKIYAPSRLRSFFTDFPSLTGIFKFITLTILITLIVFSIFCRDELSSVLTQLREKRNQRLTQAAERNKHLLTSTEEQIPAHASFLDETTS